MKKKMKNDLNVRRANIAGLRGTPFPMRKAAYSSNACMHACIAYMHDEQTSMDPCRYQGKH